MLITGRCVITALPSPFCRTPDSSSSLNVAQALAPIKREVATCRLKHGTH